MQAALCFFRSERRSAGGAGKSCLRGDFGGEILDGARRRMQKTRAQTRRKALDEATDEDEEEEDEEEEEEEEGDDGAEAVSSYYLGLVGGSK